MVKRFCDTEIWQKNWFLELDDKQKLLTKFIFDNCDCAGIYEISWKLLNVFFTNEITKADFEKIKQIRFLDENTIFIEDFILFQCSIKSLKNLNPDNNAHKGIIKRLEKFNIKTSPTLGASEGLTSPPMSPPGKGKGKGIRKDISSSLVLSSSLPKENKTEIIEHDFFGDDYHNVALTHKQYNKLLGICASQDLLNELVNSFSINIEVGKERPYEPDKPNAHYERLRSYYNYQKQNPVKFKKNTQTINGFDVSTPQGMYDYLMSQKPTTEKGEINGS